MPLKLRREYSDPDGFRKCMIPLIEGTEITTVAQANDAHQRIKDSLMDAIGLGKFLVEKKAEIGHGGFGQWIEASLRFDERTARRYMSLYSQRSLLTSGQNGQAMSDLSMTRALRILAENKKREKLKEQKKGTAKIISLQQSEDSKGMYVSSTSYRQFADAIALLESLDTKDYRYSQWVERLAEVIADMKSKVSGPRREAA
jgi:hypothetical protein